MIDFSEPNIYHGPVVVYATKVGAIIKLVVALPREINGKIFELHLFGIGEQWKHELVDVTGEHEIDSVEHMVKAIE